MRKLEAKKESEQTNEPEETVSVQESILTALDEKQQKQSQYLVELVHEIQPEQLSEFKNRDLSGLKDTLKSFSKEYEQWKERNGSDSELSDILKSAAFMKVAELMKIDGDAASIESATIALISALQEKQAKEQRTIEQVLVQNDVNDDDLLQYFAKKNEENWKDDVAAVLVTPDAAEAPPKNDNLMKELSEELEKEKKQLRDAAGSKPEVNYDLEMKKLEEQYSAKRRAMQAAFSRQRGAALQKLAAKKAARDRKDDDAEAAIAMVAAMKEEQRKVAQQNQTGKEKQRALMQSRLAARKKAREMERAQEEEAKKALENQVEETVERDDGDKREETNLSEGPLDETVVASIADAPSASAEVLTPEGDTPTAANQTVELLKLEKEDSFASVGSVESIDSDDGAKPKRVRGLKRDDSITSEDEQAILNKLEKEQATIQMRTIKEIQQSKQRLNQRLERLKREREKKGELQDKANEILGLGERQKTMLENMREEERQRATTTVRERIEKVKTERTKTMKERRDNNAAQFKEMIDPSLLEGLSEAEKMNKVAEKLQERMLAQEKELREGKRKIMVPEADDVMIESIADVESERSEATPTPPPALLSLPDGQDLNQSVRLSPRSTRRLEGDKMKQLRERRMRKREERAKSAERSQEDDAVAVDE